MRYRDGLALLPDYEYSDDNCSIKLDANEKPYSLPPLAALTLQQKLLKVALNRYPGLSACSLRTTLAAVTGVTPEQIQLGNGSSSLLNALCYIFGGAARKIVYPTPSFSMYPVYIKLAGATGVPVKLNDDYSFPLATYLAAAEKAAAAIICNPNNPTGTTIPLEDIKILAKQLSCPVIVDEAYVEFYGESALALLDQYDNLVIVRTFSKAYGLAGARLGYLIASPAISAMVAKVQLPYQINSLSLAAGQTVLEHLPEFTAEIRTIVQERDRLAQALNKVEGLTVMPSAANFLLVKTDNAARIATMLTQQGIRIRDFSNATGLTNCLRITIGTVNENQQVLVALTAALNAVRANEYDYSEGANVCVQR